MPWVSLRTISTLSPAWLEPCFVNRSVAVCESVPGSAKLFLYAAPAAVEPNVTAARTATQSSKAAQR
jgi:hypothetical protein